MAQFQDPEQILDTIVFPIRISTPFDVGDVYCYLIVDEKIVLVDTGHKSDEALSAIKKNLSDRGLVFSDIDEIWLTHGHPDHFGLASLLSEKSDPVIYGHRKEQANFACNDDRELFAEFFESHRLPGKLIDIMVNQLDWLQQFQEPVEPTWIEEGESLTTGNLTFYVKHVPGHAPGHLMFRGNSGIIFGGDVLLEHISTNALINFDPETGQRNQSLLQYRESLRWIRGQEGMILPGHGNFIHDIRQVADHHLKEHENRYRRIKDMLSDRPYSLFDLSATCFPEAMMKGDGFLVLSEVLGYLDWGKQEGTIERFIENGQVLYTSEI